MTPWCKLHNTTTDDVMIILGDAGINYYGKKRDWKLKKELSQTPITFVCVHGNHEMRPATVEGYKKIYHPEFKCFGWIEEEYPNIFFPEDGVIFFNDTVNLILGGAYSVDKDYRLERGWNWFPDEQMSEDTKNKIRHITDYTKSFDYIFSHTAPLKYEPSYLFLPQIDQSKVDKSMEKFLDEIEEKVQYNHWWFGHYHDDNNIGERVTILYQTIEQLF